jgi:hypothetical protein
MRIYTGSNLCEDKNPTSCVCWLYYDSLGRDPLYPSFYRLRGRVYMEDPIGTTVHDSDSISTYLFIRFNSISIF